MVSVEAIISASSRQSRKFSHRQPFRPDVFQLSKVTTATNAPFSPLFKTAFRRTLRGWCMSSMGPNQGRMSVTRCSLFGHSRPLISTDKPPTMPIESNHRQHTTQAVIFCLLQECVLREWRAREDSNSRPPDS